MSDLKYVGQVVAHRSLTSFVQAELIRDEKLPEINTSSEAQAAIERVVTQDTNMESKRVWAGVLGIVGLVLGGIAAALMVPEAKEVVGPAAPMWAAILGSIASGLGGGAALVSKALDPRPTR